MADTAEYAPLVQQQIQRVLQSREWGCVKEELDQLCPLVSHLWPMEGDLNDTDVRALQQVCYQKIHTGAWCDVSPVWRDAYGGACILLGLLSLLRGTPETSTFDMGLLLGGDRFRSMLHEMISMVREASPSCVVEHDTSVWVAHSCDTLLHPPRASDATLAMEQVEYSDLALDGFIVEYLSKCRPVVISGMAVDWPAYTRWNCRAYWKSLALYRTVPVEVGRDYMAEGWAQKLMPFTDFLEKIMDGNDDTRSHTLYLAQHQLLEQIPQLKNDIIIPDYCQATGDIVSINAWIGPAGTVTPIHSDPHHNVFCQLVGCKYMRVYAPEYARALKLDTYGLTYNTSTVDIETSDELKDIPCFECTLRPGDALFIPRGFFHYVKSLTPSASVSIWWDVA